MNAKQKEQLYNQYKKLAEKYAGKLFYEERLGMTKEDVVQEMRLKIYTCIEGHDKAVKEYQKYLNNKENGIKCKVVFKPMPLLPYIQCGLNNRLKDMVKLMEKDMSVMNNRLSIQDNEFDFGKSDSLFMNIDFQNNKYEINGVDILEGLQGNYERVAFIMHLKGYDKKEIKDIFKDIPISIKDVINSQLQRLRQNRHLLFSESKTFYNYNSEGIKN